MEYRVIDLNDWEQSGEGATAISYFKKDDDTKMLKLFTSGLISDEKIIQEYNFVKALGKSGISTPQVFEIVQDNKGHLGLIYERIQGKKSISRACADHPERLEEYARAFARNAKALHSIKYDPELFPEFHSRKDDIKKALADRARYDEQTAKRLLEILDKFPEEKYILHGDLQSGNLIVADGKCYWIDLGTMAYGNPMMDIGCMYFFYHFKPGRSFARKAVHMTDAQLEEFWKYFVKEYTGSESDEDLEKFNQKAWLAFLLYLVYTIDHENYSGVVLWIFLKAIKQMSKIKKTK